MSTVIIITSPPRRVQSDAEHDRSELLMAKIHETVTELQSLGIDVDIQTPES